jgi:O-antigen ligase
MHVIAQHPWLGLGQGTHFTLLVANESYTHSHNILTQTMIELGLPGFVLTMAIWLLSGWRHRQQEAQGQLLLSMWGLRQYGVAV